jgi:hypothetical protein
MTFHVDARLLQRSLCRRVKSRGPFRTSKGDHEGMDRHERDGQRSEADRNKRRALRALQR